MIRIEWFEVVTFRYAVQLRARGSTTIEIPGRYSRLAHSSYIDYNEQPTCSIMLRVRVWLGDTVLVQQILLEP